MQKKNMWDSQGKNGIGHLKILELLKKKTIKLFTGL